MKNMYNKRLFLITVGGVAFIFSLLGRAGYDYLIGHFDEECLIMLRNVDDKIAAAHKSACHDTLQNIVWRANEIGLDMHTIIRLTDLKEEAINELIHESATRNMR